MARTAEDCAILLNEMCSHDIKDTTSLNEHIPDFTKDIEQPIKGMKIGIVKEFDLSKLDSEVVTSRCQGSEFYCHGHLQ